VLHIATVHYKSPRWIEIQARYLREHISVPYRTWSSLEGIDPAYGVHFDRVVQQRGSHAGKLNQLAMEIVDEAADDDLLMFLDGDAFPIADPMPLIADALSRTPLLAVRRAENADEPQPHPCFCVTTVATWRRLPGDWTAGPTWPGPRGGPTTDVGGNLLRRLEVTETPWTEVLWSNPASLDPLNFAIYGETIYHHGAGFRTGGLSPVHRGARPAMFTLPRIPVARQLVRLANHARWRRWERRTSGQILRQSEEVYARIARDDPGWLADLK
jgi:hypothetical protein